MPHWRVSRLPCGIPDLRLHVERIWQLDVLPFRSEKLAVLSRLYQEAVYIVPARADRVKVGYTLRYAMAMLRTEEAPLLKATAEAVVPILGSTETTKSTTKRPSLG